MTSPILNSDHSIFIFHIKFVATLTTHFHILEILKKVLFSGSSLIIGIFICLLLESFQILSLFFRYGWSCSWWEIDLRFNHNKHFLFLEPRSWFCLNLKSWSWSLILILDPFFSFQTWQQIDLRFDRKKALPWRGCQIRLESLITLIRFKAGTRDHTKTKTKLKFSVKAQCHSLMIS